MTKHGVTVAAAVVAIGLTTLAEAQAVRRPAVKAPRPQWFVLSVNAGAQPGSARVEDRFTFQENVEEASVDVVYPSVTRPAFDGGLGFKLSRRFGVGVAVTRGSAETGADISASIPHPFVFGQPRQIEGREGGVSRTETAGHIQLLLFFPTKGKLQTVLSGGPSIVNLRHDVVTDVHYSETYPYDTAIFTRSTTTEATGSALGFNVAADVSYMLGRSFGLGGLVRYTHASLDLDMTSGRTASVDAGGLQVGAGIRLLF